MMTAWWLTTTASLAAVFIVSGLGKAVAPASVEATFTALRVPGVFNRAVVRRVFPWAEVFLGAALLLTGGVGFAAVAGLSLLLTVVYLTLIVAALRRPEPVSCGCFGARAAPVRRRTVWRNLALVLAAAAVLAFGGHRPWWEVVLTHPQAVLGALPVVLLGALLWWDLGSRAQRGDATAEVVSATADDRSPEYMRQPIPRVLLRRGLQGDGVLEADSARVSLRQLSSAQPVLLVRLSSECRSCRKVIADWDEMQQRMVPRVTMLPVFGAGDPEPPHIGSLTAEEYLVDVHGEFDAVFDAAGTPWAVLLGADGWLAGGPESGRAGIDQMIGEIVEAIEVHQPNGVGAAVEGASAQP